MNHIFSKFNIYDQIGYLLVGSIALLVTYFDFLILRIRFPNFDLTSLPLWIIVGYFLGHLIQAIANVFIREKKENFSDREKELLNIARGYFNLENFSDPEIWNLCYMLTSAKDITGQIQAFNAYYSLYRGWFIVFTIESLFIMGHTIFGFTYLKIPLLILSLAIAVLFYRRSNRFYNYLQSKVLQTFVVTKALEKF